MKLLVPALALAAAASQGYSDDCTHRADRSASVDLAGARRVRIEANAGSLVVKGRAGATRLEAKGVACSSKAEWLEGIRLLSRRDGDTVILTAEIPERNWSMGESARLDLTVDVPASLAVMVHDGSGSAEISGVASLVLEDGSGEATVRDVAGDVDVKDGSGSMTLTQVRGNVTVEDGSGSIEVSDVGGSVTVTEDGSGGIEVSGVGGTVRVQRDGSGSIAVRNVTGDLVVERDGSGRIDHDGVKGKVDIPKHD